MVRVHPAVGKDVHCSPEEKQGAVGGHPLQMSHSFKGTSSLPFMLFEGAARFCTPKATTSCYTVSEALQVVIMDIIS